MEEQPKPKEQKPSPTFSQAFEILAVTPPENLVRKIFELIRSIQNANEQDIVAIWHTLQLIKKTTKNNPAAQEQAEEMQNAVKSRMKFLSMTVQERGNRTITPHEMERYFKSITE